MLDRSRAFEADRPTSASKGGTGSTANGFAGRLIKPILDMGWLFIVTVILPTLLAVLYFGIFASDVFISESTFVVRAPDKPAASGLGLLLKTAGFSNAGDEVYVVQDYVRSRDAVMDLDKGGELRRAYQDARISIFDRFNPIGWDGSFEALYKFYQNKVSIERDGSSSITKLTVRAYSAKEARKFNSELLGHAEALVNRLNNRGQKDLVSIALQEVADAKKKATDTAIALSRFRNSEGLIDPEKQASAQLQMISKLQDQLIATRIQLMQLRAYTPENPQIPVLQTGERKLAAQIDEELGKVAGSNRSLSSSAVEYQRLLIESDFSAKQVAASLASLEEARNEARRKQAYIERIAQPSLPDNALEPRRLRGIITTLVVGLVAWGIFSMLLASLKEHRD